MHNFSFIYITCHYGCDVETGCKMKKYLFLALFVCLLPDVAAAGMREYFQQVQRDVKETWKSDEYDLFVPVYAWHNRLTYDQKHIDKYNENPWGLGLGKTRYDENGNWHSLYARAFKDSNKYLETIFGYAWMKNWFVNCNRDIRVGLGYTLSLTQRHEYKYIPVPLPLPLAGIEYKKVALQAAYVPGVKNDGNVLFIWTRIGLN